MPYVSVRTNLCSYFKLEVIEATKIPKKIRQREKTEAPLSRSHGGNSELASLPGLFGFFLAESFVWFSAEKCWNSCKPVLKTWCLRQIDALMSPGAPFAQVNVKYLKVTGVKSNDETNDIQSTKICWKDLFSHFQLHLHLIQMSQTVKIIRLFPQEHKI